jgi:hypothetical protein
MSSNFYQNQNVYIKKYYLPPPLINASLIYQDINNDKNLRKNVTTYFLEKCIKWCLTDKQFNNSKKNISKLKSKNGIIIIYNILREIVKKYNYNWYDLRTMHYDLVKNYFKNNLNLI